MIRAEFNAPKCDPKTIRTRFERVFQTELNRLILESWLSVLRRKLEVEPTTSHAMSIMDIAYAHHITSSENFKKAHAISLRIGNAWLSWEEYDYSSHLY